MSLDDWRIVVSTVAFLSPLLILGVIGWIARYFVRKVDYEGDRVGDAVVLKEHLDGLGKRIDPLVDARRELDVKYDVLDKKSLQSEFDRTRLHEEIGRLEGVAQKLSESIVRHAENEGKELKSINDRLIRIEERMSVAESLDKGMARIAEIMTRRDRDA